VIEVAQLPENELLIVIEMVDSLKKQRIHPNRVIAAEIIARAKARATETSHLSRSELMQEFGDILESIRAEAISRGKNRGVKILKAIPFLEVLRRE